MKNLIQIIQEKLIFNKHTKRKYNYHPKTGIELQELIIKLIYKRGNDADLNDIDTSEITDMSKLFISSEFNGDISLWDVSSVKNMAWMFSDSKFNGDISDWDVRNVEDMTSMFYYSKFTGENGDISKWNVNNVRDMRYMFDYSPLEKNPPKWYKE